MRVDKYLWSIRVFKTRSQSTEACKKNKVSLLGQTVKPSKELNKGTIVEVRKGAIQYKYQVLEFPKSRVGAKLVQDYVLDITEESELKKLEMIKLGKPMVSQKKELNKGRPTKKTRREIDKFMKGE